MKIKEKYKLYLSWGKVITGRNTIFLKDAFFYGPVLKEAAKLEGPDFILLDITEQFFHALKTFFIVKLSWDNVRYESQLLDQLAQPGAAPLHYRIAEKNT